MTKLAVIHATRILEFVDSEFEAHPDIKFISVPDDTTVQDKYVDGGVVKFTETLLTLDQIRMMRNAKLTESDWSVGPDSPLSDSDKALWVTYRQELRDFPSVVDLNNVVWPTKPE